MGLFEGAARRRRAAEMERRLAELDEWDRRYGLGGAPPGHPARRPDTTWRHHSPDGGAPLRAFDPVPVRGSHRPPRRRRGPLVLFLLALATATAVVSLPEQTETVRGWATAAGRSVLGMPQADPRADASRADQSLGERVVDAMPILEHLPSGWEPAWGLRVLPEVDSGTQGSHAFLQTQEGTGHPVGFSPCGEIPVAVNPEGAPDDYEELVRASIERVSAASGLQLKLVGETDDTWTEGPRRPGSPVVVLWSDPESVPRLAEAAGLGGATYVTGRDHRLWHASGQVVLDRTELLTWEQQSAVLDHEFGHVLGLDHVDDPGELMAAINMGVTSFGPGDLAGLAALGSIPCPGL